MFCYDLDIAQLEACWLSVKRTYKENLSSSHNEAVAAFVKAFQDHNNLTTTALPLVKAKWNAAIFVTLIKNMLPKGTEETTCESMYEIFGDMDWTLYLKLVDGLEMEEHLKDCLCQLEDEIYPDILKLILNICQKDETLKVSRLANPVLSSIFIRYPSLRPPKRYGSIISEAALWLAEMKQENCKDFGLHFKWFVDTATVFADLLLTVLADRLYNQVGENYKIGTAPTIKNLAPFNSAKHWIHMARLFHRYICPHHWMYLGIYAEKLQPIQFLLRCLTVFKVDVLHPRKKPKLIRVFKKRDFCRKNIVVSLFEEEKDIDDHLEALEECLKEIKTSNKKVLFLKTYVSRHVVYQVMQRLLTVCTLANEEHKKTISLHFLNMCEQSLLPFDVILGLYLEICQGTELLKQPEYTQEMTTFLNQATECHQVDELLPPMVQLCLQSPKTVVYNVIHRALESKGHIPTLVKLLAEVSIICRFKEKSHPSSLLTSCLKSFAKKATTTKQTENLAYFIQELVKLNSTKNTLDLSEFTSVVIVPLLNPESNPVQADLACQLLHIVLDSSPAILSCNITVLAMTLVHFTNRHINSAELTKADKFFSLLLKMKNQLPDCFASPELEWSKKQLEDFHPLLRIKASEVFHLSTDDLSIQGINNLEKALMQSTIVQGDGPTALASKHLSSLSHTLRYAALVAALSKVLPVLSQVDWIPVFQLINILLVDILEQNNKDEPNDKTVLMLRAMTDALVVHHKKLVSTNWTYVLSSYGQAIKHFSSNLEENSEHVPYAFCEVCRLANDLPHENSQNLLASLLHLIGQAASNSQKDHTVMLRVAINGLSNETLKQSLLTHLESQNE